MNTAQIMKDAEERMEKALGKFRDDLKVMDIGAFEMCRRANLPILVFNYKQDAAIEKAIAGQRVGTIVGG